MKLLNTFANKGLTILIALAGVALCVFLTFCDEGDLKNTESESISNSEDSIEMPNVVGMLASDATDVLREAGFKNIDYESNTGEMVIAKSNWIVIAQEPSATAISSMNGIVILDVARKEAKDQVEKTDNADGGDNRVDVDISKLQVSRYEESEMDGADSYHVYSNVGASEANLAAFRGDCIIGVVHAFNMPADEATSYVDRALAGESRVVIKDKYYSYTLTFEVDSIANKQGAYSLDMYPDTIGWLDW